MSSNKEKDAEATCPIQVVVRCRPCNEREKVEGILSFPSRREISVSHRNSRQSKTYTFDQVYSPDANQIDIFDTTVKPIVCEVMQGFNCTIFAYGQTGTGKTYTMEGAARPDQVNSSQGLPKDAGIIPRAVDQIFHMLSKQSEYTVSVSFLELYNENLRDLSADKENQTNLRVLDDANHGTNIQGMEEVPVLTPSDVFRELSKGSQHRQVAETKMNATSSRSHSIFTIIIRTKEPTPGGEDLCRIGKLNLVDLAGSENVGKSGVKDTKLQEAKNINKSLVASGRVINALVEKSSGNHVPYRESKLTRISRDSSGGHTKTCIIATVSPSSCSYDETNSTLDYASKAKNIKNAPQINQKMTAKTLIKEIENTNAILRRQLEAARSGSGFYVDNDTWSEMHKTKEYQLQEIERSDARIKASDDEKNIWLNAFHTKQEENGQLTCSLHDKTEKLEMREQELSETQNVLQQTQDVVQAQSAEISTHKKVENMLFSDAQALSSTSKGSMHDNDQLHSKVARKTSVEENNFKVVEQSGTQLEKYTREKTEKIGDFRAAQSMAVRASDGCMEEALTQTTDQLAVSRSQISGLEGLSVENHKAMASSVDAHREKIDGELDEISSTGQAASALHGKLLEKFLEDSCAVAASSRAQVETHERELSLSLSLQRERAIKSRDSSLLFSSQQSQKSTQVEEFTTSHAANQTQRSQSTRETLDKSEGDYKQTAQFVQEQLFKNINDMVQKAFQQTTVFYSESLRTVHNTVDHHTRDVKEGRERVVEEVGGLKDSCRSFSVEKQENARVELEEISKMEKLVQNHVVDQTQSAAASATLHTAFQSESSDQQKDLDSTLSRHVTHAKSQTCEFTSHHTESATSHSQSQKQVTDGLTSHVETINTSLIQNSEKERSIVEDSHQQHEQRTQQLHSDTMDFHLSASRSVAAVKRDVPTGATPVRKNLSFPTIPPMTPVSGVNTYTVRATELTLSPPQPLFRDEVEIEETKLKVRAPTTTKLAPPSVRSSKGVASGNNKENLSNGNKA